MTQPLELGDRAALRRLLDEAVGDLFAYGAEEATNALTRKDRDQYQFWQGWTAALQRVETALAGAAGPSPSPDTHETTHEDHDVARGPSPSPDSATGSPRSPQRDGSRRTEGVDWKP